MASQAVSVHEAKTHLSRLLARVDAGEEIIIARAGEPVARLVPLAKRRAREPGADEVVLADDFDALPAPLTRAFGQARRRPR